jgi:hypothetical protein
MILLITAGAPGVALAQNSLPIVAEPLVHQQDGNVVGCGIRVTGGRPGPASRSTWFDVSFNVFRRGIALVQAVAYEMPRSSVGDSRPARVPVQSAWIKAGTGSGSPKLGETAERMDWMVYSLALDEALSLFDATARAQPLTLGIKPWGQRSESVYDGVPSVSDAAREQIAACLARLTE